MTACICGAPLVRPRQIACEFKREVEVRFNYDESGPRSGLTLTNVVPAKEDK